MSFEATSTNYAVPVPLDLVSSARARYITDVVVMDPVCQWTVPDPPIKPPTDPNEYFAKVNISLPAFGVGSEPSVSALRE
jgi:hypothetical protein